jgi:hypothetical protein
MSSDSPAAQTRGRPVAGNSSAATASTSALPRPGGRSPRCTQWIWKSAGLTIVCSSASPSTSTTAIVRWPAGRCSAIAAIAGRPVSSPTRSVQSAAGSVVQCVRGPPKPTLSPGAARRA